MKVQASLRSAFDAQVAVNRDLERRVTDRIESFRERRWHFESRLKSEESFALKVEAGYVSDPSNLDDFLACVLVVPNLDDIGRAEVLATQTFEFVSRRPPSGMTTRKPADSFAFDDIRLYLRIGTDDSLPPQASDATVFELQLRTFLQHAWSVSTHDVVYKADSVSWPRERIASQIKAMLEHAELAIDNIAALEASAGLPSVAQEYEDCNATIAVLRENWSGSHLPVDLKRLASAVLSLSRAVAGLDPIGVAELLEKGRTRYGGSHNLDWSPYRVVSEYLVDTYEERFRRLLRKQGHKRLVYVETLDRLGLMAESAQGAILV